MNYVNHYCHYCIVVTFSISMSQFSKLSQMSQLSMSSEPSSSSLGRSVRQKWSQRGANNGTEKENLVHRAAGIHAEKHSLIILAPRDELQLDLFSFESLFVDCSNQNTIKTLSHSYFHKLAVWWGRTKQLFLKSFFWIFSDMMGLVGVPLAGKV